MKRVLIFLVFISLSSLGFAQRFGRNPNNYGNSLTRSDNDSTLYLPTGCGVPTDSTWLFSQGFNGSGEKRKKFAIYGDSCGGNVYLWNPHTKAWSVIGSGGGGGSTDSSVYSTKAYRQKLADSLAILITLKLNITDSAGIYSTRARLAKTIDSMIIVNNARYLKPTDTFNIKLRLDTLGKPNAIYIRGHGQPGDTTIITAHDSVISPAAIRDSSATGQYVRHTVNPDGSWTFYNLPIAGGSGSTNITITRAVGYMVINSSSGTGDTIRIADSLHAGLMDTTMYWKLQNQLTIANDTCTVCDSLAYAIGNKILMKQVSVAALDPSISVTRDVTQNHVIYRLHANGGGGSQTLEQVLTTGSTLTTSHTTNNGGLHQVSTNGENLMDSLHIKPDPYVVDSITFFGTSISYGVGASDPRFRWTTVLSNRLNAAEANYAVSGSSGQVDFLNYGWKTHPADRYHRWFVIEYSVNDIINSGNVATWDTAHYGPILRARVDSLINYYGYAAGQIVLLSPSYISSATYANATAARQLQYFAMIQSVATTRGCKFVDILTPENNQGGALLMYDGALHPGDAGHDLYAKYVANALADSVKEQAQALAVNGVAEFQKIKFRGDDTSTFKARVMMADSAGFFKRAPLNLFPMNSYFFTQPQPIGLNIGGQVNFGYTAQSLPPAAVEAMQVNGAGKFGAIRVTGGMPGGTLGNSGNLAYTGGNFYIYSAPSSNMLLNSFGGQVGVGGAPIDNISELSISGNLIASGSALHKGSISFNSSSGAGTYIGYNTGIGYIGAYNFTTSAASPLAINYQGGNVLIGKNTDDGLALLQIAGKEELGTIDSTAAATGGYVYRDAITHLLKLAPGTSGSGASGSSDSLKRLPVDTSASPRNGSVLTFDSTNHKWYLSFQSGGGGGGTPGNPTASIGLSAINGSASTYMRSDAAPVISQSIVPTWTGVHSFTPTITASAGAATGMVINGAFTAAANSDNLYALKISPTFTNGSFTTVNNGALWAHGGVTYLDGGLMVSGGTPTGGFKNFIFLNTGSNCYMDSYNSSGTAIPLLVNNFSGAAVSFSGNVNALANLNITGFFAAKGGIGTNNSALNGGYNGGIGYLSAYGASAEAPLALNYTAVKPVLIGKNTDDGLGALLQINGRVSIATVDSTTSPVNMLYQDVNGIVKKAALPTGGAGLSYTWASSLNTADYTIAASNAIKLVDLTGQANHNIVLPSSPTGNQVLLIVRNINSSGFTWTFTGGAVKDAGNNTVTALANNTTYQLSWDGTTYVIIN